MSKLKVTFNDDGSLKLDAREMVGSEADLLEALGDLAKECGGELEVEKHMPGIHHHHHHGHHHHGKGGGHSH